MRKSKLLAVLMMGLLSAGELLAQWPEDVRSTQQVRRKYALLIIFDVSGSMYGAPLVTTKRTLWKALKNYPADSPAGLVSFSGCRPGSVRLEVPLVEGRGQQVVDAAMRLHAGGNTDIQTALRMGASEIARLGKEYCTKVLLLSDGTDTCGGRRVTMMGYVKNIMETNPNCNGVNVISIGVSDEWDKKIFDEIQKVGSKGTKKEHTQVGRNDKEIEKVIYNYLKKFNPKEKSVGVDWKGDYTGKPQSKPLKNPQGKNKVAVQPPKKGAKNPKWEELKNPKNKAKTKGGGN